MSLKPWYKVVTPREDLREGRPLDASEFADLSGRGGQGGTPRRCTPWGEIAFRLGGAEGFAAVVGHDEERTAPANDVIRRCLPHDRPVPAEEQP